MNLDRCGTVCQKSRESYLDRYLEETNYSLLSPVQMFLERLQSVSVLADVDVLDEDDDVVGVFLRGLFSVLRVFTKSRQGGQMSGKETGFRFGGLFVAGHV